MKTHKIKQIIKKQGGNYQVVFNDGTRVFWPREYANDLNVGTRVREHQHKNGETVAFSWAENIRFVVPQPLFYEDAVEFLEKFRLFDTVAFNKAVVRSMHYAIEPLMLPDVDKFAQNIVLLGIKKHFGKSR